jgi:hypothetical protein
MFECLDFVYLPSRDVAADVTHFTRRLGRKLVFAIAAFGTRVAMVQLDPHPPPLLLAEHLQGDQPVLVYRVDELDRAIAELRDREVEVAARFEIPHGPGAELANPGPRGWRSTSSHGRRPMRASPVGAISELCGIAYVAEQTATVRDRAGPLARATNQSVRRGADQASSDDSTCRQRSRWTRARDEESDRADGGRSMPRPGEWTVTRPPLSPSGPTIAVRIVERQGCEVLSPGSATSCF